MEDNTLLTTYVYFDTITLELGEKELVMKLLTKANLKDLPAIGSTEGKGWDALATVKFFTPDSNWTWYAVEYDADEKLFYGLVDGFDMELGYFSLTELENSRGPLGLPIERDLHFDPAPLSEIKNG